MTLQQRLQDATAINRMGTDTVSGLNRIDYTITARIRQVRAGLITEDEAIQLCKMGIYYQS